MGVENHPHRGKPEGARREHAPARNRVATLPQVSFRTRVRTRTTLHPGTDGSSSYVRSTKHARERVSPHMARDGRCHDSEKDRKSTRLNSSHANISYAV